MKKYTIHSLRTESPLEVDTRMAVLRRKAKADRLSIPDEVMSFIAEQFATSRYELEGALMRILAYASIVNQDLSVELAMQALNTDVVTNTSATMYEPVRLEQAVENKVPIDTRHKIGSKHRIFPLWYQRNVVTGVAEGVLLSTVSTLALALTCLAIDVVLKQIGLLTLSVPWIWWTVVALNALTVFIPIDIYRLRKQQSNHSAHARASVITYGVLELTVVTLFLILLFRFQTTDIQILQSLGLLQNVS